MTRGKHHQHVRDRTTTHHRDAVTKRNEQERIADELPQRYKIWLGRIIASGSHGATIDELSQRSGLPANRFSGRITELKKLGLVERTSQRRPTRKGHTAAVIVATDQARQQTKHHDFTSVRSAKKKSNELPDAITNTTIPRDENGDLIVHGECYVIPGTGLVEVYYEITEDEFYIFRPWTPEQRQPVSLLPPQKRAWHHTTCF